MSLTDFGIGQKGVGSTLFEWRSRMHQAWSDASQRTRTIVQIAALLIIVVVAYNYTFLTLLQNAGQETPLAYVSLVPFMALGLAAVRARPAGIEPDIHDRQVDYIVGVPLMLTSLAVNIFLPAKLSAMFWVYRIDLLTLPFFVAGAVAVIFGVRVLWRQKLAVGFLILGWPYPYESVLLRVLNAFTSTTVAGINKILGVLHVATPSGPASNAIFDVTHNGHTFPLSVVSACSGVNSVVGFLLVGSAFAAIVRGPLVRKVLWLLGGMVLLWAINLMRIIFIFWAGKAWGEHVAIGILHPFVGLVTFSLGVIVMILLIRPLGMRIGYDAQSSALPGRSPSSAAGLATKRPLAVPKVFAAIVVVLGIGVALGVSNSGLRTYNLVADASGDAKLVSYQASPVAPAGWTSRLEDTFDWAKPLFGDDSTWNRYLLLPVQTAQFHANTSVVADVINTTDLQSFSAFGVVQCYEFHGYSLTHVSQVSLPGGITGQALSYTSQLYGSWSILDWIVPVKKGTGTSYERTVLYVQNRPGAKISLVGTGLENVESSNSSQTLRPLSPAQRQLVVNQTFLVGFAKELISDQANRTGSTTTSTDAPKAPHNVAGFTA